MYKYVDFKGMSEKLKICISVPILNLQGVDYVLDKRRLNKEEVKKHYINGFTAIQIANKVGATVASVEKCISRNLKDYKEEHLINKRWKMETLKVLDKNNDKCISDFSLLKMNRQSYNYDSNYNLIFNEERGARPNDVPKKIKRAI